MNSAMDPDYVPDNDGTDWLYRLDVRLCTDTTMDGRFVEQILAALKQHDRDSLKRVGEVLERRRSMLELTPEQRDLFVMVCDLLPHADKTASYRAMRRENNAQQRNNS